MQEYRLTVTEVPPPAFTMAPPQTEVRDSVTLRAAVTGARGLAAVRTVVTWDPATFSLREGSVVATGATWRSSRTSRGAAPGGHGVPGRTLDGDHTLFSFVLEPLVEPATLWLDQRVEFLSRGPDPSKQHHFLRQSEGRSLAPSGADQRGPGRQQDEDRGPAARSPGEDPTDEAPNDENPNGNGSGLLQPGPVSRQVAGVGGEAERRLPRGTVPTRAALQLAVPLILLTVLALLSWRRPPPTTPALPSR